VASQAPCWVEGMTSWRLRASPEHHDAKDSKTNGFMAAQSSRESRLWAWACALDVSMELGTEKQVVQKGTAILASPTGFGERSMGRDAAPGEQFSPTPILQPHVLETLGFEASLSRYVGRCVLRAPTLSTTQDKKGRRNCSGDLYPVLHRGREASGAHKASWVPILRMPNAGNRIHRDQYVLVKASVSRRTSDLLTYGLCRVVARIEMLNALKIHRHCCRTHHFNVALVLRCACARADGGSNDDGVFVRGHGVLYVRWNEQEATNGVRLEVLKVERFAKADLQHALNNRDPGVSRMQ